MWGGVRGTYGALETSCCDGTRDPLPGASLMGTESPGTPLTTVDNSDVVPTRLTAHPTLLMISKLFLQHLSSNEDSDVPLCVHVPARDLPLPFAGEARASLLVPSSAFLLTRRGQA